MQVNENVSYLIYVKLYQVLTYQSKLQDCAAFFNEARNRDVRHAMAAMMVELLVPVAGVSSNINGSAHIVFVY